MLSRTGTATDRGRYRDGPPVRSRMGPPPSLRAAGRGSSAYTPAAARIVAAQPRPLRPIQVVARGPLNHSTVVNRSPTARAAAHAVMACQQKPAEYQ